MATRLVLGDEPRYLHEDQLLVRHYIVGVERVGTDGRVYVGAYISLIRLATLSPVSIAFGRWGLFEEFTDVCERRV